MQFKVNGEVSSVVASGQGKKGAWYLYAIKETFNGDKTKTWRIFSNQDLMIGASYSFEGYISESPNDRYKDQNGKASYQTTFNATNITPSDDIPF